MSDEPTEEQWQQYVTERDKKMLPVPEYVHRFDGTYIVAWDDVPEVFQKKMLAGEMTDEDWNSDWDGLELNKPALDTEILNSLKRHVDDIISDMLCTPEPPVANHLHVWRKEYKTCMLKGCGAVRNKHG